MADDRKVTFSFGTRPPILRECIAFFFWAYILIKLFVFDLDVYLVESLAPQLRWILNFKVFLILAILAGALITLGRKKFLRSLLYVLAYPLVVLFWKLPWLACKKWPLTIAFAPVIYRAVSTFPTTFLLYTLAALSGLVIVIGSESILLVTAMLGFFVFLSAHLYCSFREAYCVGVTAGLSTILRKLKDEIQKGIFDHVAPAKAMAAQAQSTSVGETQKNPTSLYLLRSCTDIVIDKVRWVARSRKYDLYLVLSWLYTVGVTAIAFAFEFLALGKIDSKSFGPTSGLPDFWEFLGFSLGNLPLAKISRIVPLSHPAVFLTYAEELSGVLIFVILVFTVLTSARESYKQDLDHFSCELTAIADAVDDRVTAVYKMSSIYEVEIFLLRDNAGLVNGLRKARGLSELTDASPDAPSERKLQTPCPAWVSCR